MSIKTYGKRIQPLLTPVTLSLPPELRYFLQQQKKGKEIEEVIIEILERYKKSLDIMTVKSGNSIHLGWGYSSNTHIGRSVSAP